MKNFIEKNGETLFILFVVAVVTATMVFYIFSGNMPPGMLPGTGGPIAGATQNNGQEIPKGDGQGQPSTNNNNNNNNNEVTLNDGRVIKVGEAIQMIEPTYQTVNKTLYGTVSRVYPEQKRALIWVQDGVVELTYRYVIEMKATKFVQSDNSSQEQPLTDTVRGVVTLNEQGAEVIHFLQDLDNPNWAGKYRATQLADTAAQQNLKIYKVPGNEANIPEYIVQFYRANQ